MPHISTILSDPWCCILIINERTSFDGLSITAKNKLRINYANYNWFNINLFRAFQQFPFSLARVRIRNQNSLIKLWNVFLRHRSGKFSLRKTFDWRFLFTGNISLFFLSSSTFIKRKICRGQFDISIHKNQTEFYLRDAKFTSRLLDVHWTIELIHALTKFDNSKFFFSLRTQN